MRSRHRFIVSRSMVREALPSLLMATGVTTFLLIIRVLFNLAELFVAKGAPGWAAVNLMLLNLPSVLAMTLPIGALFAVLMTTARWSADSELIAIQACGISLARAVRPLLAMAAGVFLLNLANTWFLMPSTNLQSRILSSRLMFSFGAAKVQAREFVEDFPGYLLYVNKIDPSSGTWHGIVLFDTTKPLEEQLVLARSGRYTVSPTDGAATLSLQDATTHLLQPDQPAKYRQNVNRTLELYLRPTSLDPTVRIRWGASETSSADLLSRVSDTEVKPYERLDARVELHKRLAIPAAALVFVLVGFPLGIHSRRGGKGFGLTASVLLVVVYYVLLLNGESLASSGRLPVGLGIWLPNLALFGLGVLLLRRAVRGGISSSAPRPWHLPAIAVRALGFLARPRKGRTPSGTTPRWWPSLGIIDAHVIRTCTGFLMLVVLAVCGLWTTVNLSEKLSDIQRHAPEAWVVLTYYLFLLPQILHDTLPLAFLIAFLATTAVLERHNETTALKASGISLLRVTLPLLFMGLVLAVGLFIVDDQFTYRANRASQKLGDIIAGKKQARSHRATDQLWLFMPDGRTLVNFMEFDPDTSTLVRPSLFVFDEEMNLRSRHMAHKATFVDGRWKAEGAWSRTFRDDGLVDYEPSGPRLTDLPLLVDKAYFGKEYRKANQMSFAELSQYIRKLRAAGYRVDRLRVQLHQKLAYPLTLVLLPWLALSFAFQMARRGTVMGIALALVLGMFYFFVLAFTTRAGEASLIPPVLASWSPTVIFALLAVNRQTYLRT